MYMNDVNVFQLLNKSALLKITLASIFPGKLLYEYSNAADFKADRLNKTYELNKFYYGTGHVIYAGSFYYHRAGYNELVKYDLASERVVGTVALPHGEHEGTDGQVYATDYNFFDCAADENGLWVIYSSDQSDTALLVSKLDPDALSVVKTWNITVDHKSRGNGFITCGVLYLVNSVRSKITKIDFAYDLYEKRKVDVDLRFTNPFQMNNMIAYNPKTKEIHSWDKGNQLTYPLLL